MLTNPPTQRPVRQVGDYRRRDWRLDWLASDAGADPWPCPKCARVGFYGPRIRPFRKYRACRFCGFWQDVDGEPQYRVAVVHGCEAWPEVAGAPYLWWVMEFERQFTCPFCMSEVDVSGARERNPAFDRKHPWWRVPQNRSFERYSKYWSAWQISRGRAFL